MTTITAMESLNNCEQYAEDDSKPTYDFECKSCEYLEGAKEIVKTEIKISEKSYSDSNSERNTAYKEESNEPSTSQSILIESPHEHSSANQTVTLNKDEYFEYYVPTTINEHVEICSAFTTSERKSKSSFECIEVEHSVMLNCEGTADVKEEDGFRNNDINEEDNSLSKHNTTVVISHRITQHGNSRSSTSNDFVNKRHIPKLESALPTRPRSAFKNPRNGKDKTRTLSDTNFFSRDDESMYHIGHPHKEEIGSADLSRFSSSQPISPTDNARPLKLQLSQRDMYDKIMQYCVSKPILNTKSEIQAIETNVEENSIMQSSQISSLESELEFCVLDEDDDSFVMKKFSEESMVAVLDFNIFHDENEASSSKNHY